MGSGDRKIRAVGLLKTMGPVKAATYTRSAYVHAFVREHAGWRP